MADDVEKGLDVEADNKCENTEEDGAKPDEGPVPLNEEEQNKDGFNSAESTPEHLLTEKTPLTKSGSNTNDIELQDVKKGHLTPEVVNRESLFFVQVDYSSFVAERYGARGPLKTVCDANLWITSCLFHFLQGNENELAQPWMFHRSTNVVI